MDEPMGLGWEDRSNALNIHRSIHKNSIMLSVYDLFSGLNPTTIQPGTRYQRLNSTPVDGFSISRDYQYAISPISVLFIC